MVQFLLLMGFLGMLIVSGISISLYLYKQGVIRNTSFESMESYQRELVGARTGEESENYS